jgi:hypothetical protein
MMDSRETWNDIHKKKNKNDTENLNDDQHWPHEKTGGWSQVSRMVSRSCVL